MALRPRYIADKSALARLRYPEVHQFTDLAVIQTMYGRLATMPTDVVCSPARRSP